jgi:CBS domain-containing protein|tara:strand:+ start:126 stop:815 length:690 start_codon:yes stop_codon:yes gene_type:complete
LQKKEKCLKYFKNKCENSRDSNMKVSELIQKKQTKMLHIMEDTAEKSSVAIGSSIKSALSLIAQTPNSAMVVAGIDGQVVGIISEKDIIVAIETHGVTVLADEVETIMTPNMERADLSSDCESVLSKMVEGNFRNMPIFEDGKFHGIVQTLEVAEGKMSEVLEENRKLKELAQILLSDNYYFHETDDAHEVQAKMMGNEMPYALISRENGLTVIVNSSDFLSLGIKSEN